MKWVNLWFQNCGLMNQSEMQKSNCNFKFIGGQDLHKSPKLVNNFINGTHFECWHLANIGPKMLLSLPWNIVHYTFFFSFQILNICIWMVFFLETKSEICLVRAEVHFKDQFNSSQLLLLISIVMNLSLIFISNHNIFKVKDFNCQNIFHIDIHINHTFLYASKNI